MDDLLQRVFSLDVVAIVLSLASLLVARRALKVSKAKFAVDLREQWIEKVSQAIKAVLPSNNIPLAAGLTVARLADSMPEELIAGRREIIEHGYLRAVPGGGFHEFWSHLCEIQKWPVS